MDLNPNPFAGKRRPVAGNPAKKDRDRTKPSSQPPPPPPPTRPRRTFGTIRNPNVPVDKLPSTWTKNCSKPWKPSGNRTQSSASDVISVTGSAKKKPDGEKSQQKTSSQAAVRVSGRNKCLQDEEANSSSTPVSSTKAEEEGTPYLSAENCSKCRFDKLEMSAYWLAQIKIAELAGKHSVSAAFFRLAAECCAQPFCSLQSEFKYYVVRHKSSLSQTLWDDLCRLYEVSDEQPDDDFHELDKLDVVLVKQEDSKESGQVDEGNCQALEDECFEYDFIDDPVSEKEITKVIVANDNGMNDELVDVKPTPTPTPTPKPAEDSPMKNGGLKPNIGHEKSKNLCLNSSTLNAKTGRSSSKDQNVWNHNQPKVMTSADKLAKVTVRAKLDRSSQLQNTEITDQNNTAS